jgi:hypothetical protein
MVNQKIRPYSVCPHYLVVALNLAFHQHPEIGPTGDEPSPLTLAQRHDGMEIGIHHWPFPIPASVA